MRHVFSSCRKISAAAVLAACFIAGPDARAEDWQWTITPYIWAADTSLDVTINDQVTVGGELEFEDLLDKIDFVIQLHAEGRRGQWGFFGDVTWMDIKEGQTVPPTGPFPGGSNVTTEATMGIYELGGFFRPLGEDLGLDLLGGVRVLDYDQDITLMPQQPMIPDFVSGLSDTYFDVFAGLRYQLALGKHFEFVVRGDVGVGQTELTLNAVGLLAWHLGSSGRYHLLAGYRYLDVELDKDQQGQNIEPELTMSGPVVGFAFRF